MQAFALEANLYCDSSPSHPLPMHAACILPARKITHPRQVDVPEVWSELGHSQLEANEVGDAIESYLRSGDHSRHAEVIHRSTQAGAHAQLVKYLLMVRKKVKDPKVLSLNPSSSSWECASLRATQSQSSCPQDLQTMYSP